MDDLPSWISLEKAWRAVTKGADAPRLQEKLLQNALRDGEIKSVAAHVTFGDPGDLGSLVEKEGVRLDRDFWRFAIIEWKDSSAVRSEMSVEIEPNVVKHLSHMEVLGIAVDQDDLIIRWYLPDFFENTSRDAVQDTPARRKGAGGRRGNHDWERCLIEAARWMHHEGVPNRQADLIRYIEEWFGDDAPSGTQLKEHLGPLYLAFVSGNPQP
ncbi:hypothetical protein [Methylobacterium tarhaniae]|uniref:hypothetical protein n=1 Tax=Methylobacterium tarhaniae TaxID=1187852 RepID=UPI000AF782E5|nr:hypothetical protein [Methylobacterium tarhaniae]